MTEGATNLDLEPLLADALRPIEPPESLATRVETTLSGIAEQAAAELSSWADELTRERAAGAARPAQLGAPGGRGRRRRRRRRGAGAGRDAAPATPATACATRPSGSLRELRRS